MFRTGLSLPYKIVGMVFPDSMFRTGLSLPYKIVEMVFSDSLFRTELSLPDKIVQMVFPGRQNVQNRIIPSNTKCQFLTALVVFFGHLHKPYSGNLILPQLFVEACLLAVSTFKDILLSYFKRMVRGPKLLAFYTIVCVFSYFDQNGPSGSVRATR